jgi:pimeloyl-ACP methyl ester carboxylesterase
MSATKQKFSDEQITGRFPVGYYPFHPNISLNFQMNRFYGWAGDDRMLDELKEAVSRIANYDDWARVMLELSDEALADGRALQAAYYARGAQFFLSPSDPRFKPALQRFFDNVESGLGVTAENKHSVPYKDGDLFAYRFTPEQPRGTLVVFGGYDSYIAEWLPAALAFRDAGLDTVIFDGPGQGVVLDAGVPMTPDWHLPVGAVLDYFNLTDITLMGFSLGGGLVVRASAREPRVKRTICWDVFTDFYEVGTRSFPGVGLGDLAANSQNMSDEAINVALAVVRKSDLLADWSFAQGERVMGTSTSAGVLRGWRQYITSDISDLVTQPVLLMAGTKDHYVPLHQLGDQVLTLTGAPSITGRVFTEAEQAQNHCQVGNQGLALKVIFDWLDTVGGRLPE